MAIISDVDRNLSRIEKYVTVCEESCVFDFKAASCVMKRYRPDIEMTRLDLVGFAHFLRNKRSFLVVLLQNRNLLEHEMFAETLMATFHLVEELTARDLNKILDSGIRHAKHDIERAYGFLMRQWADYMEYTRVAYPYFSLFAMATNPFNKNKAAFQEVAESACEVSCVKES